MYFKQNKFVKIHEKTSARLVNNKFSFKLFKKGLIKISKKNFPMYSRRNVEKTFHEENFHKKSA